MFKLNNKGWGYRDMIIYSSIILIALFIATYYVIALYSSLDKATKENLNSNIYVDYYTPKESTLANAAKTYMIDKNIDVIGDKYKIDADILIKNGYIDQILGKDDKKCSGYAIVTYDVTYSAKGYIKCNGYKTEGYED